jgi:LysR family transcriptional regulator, glycine cleavage system transcriptional activator
MSPPLPSLNGLCAFEAVARFGSVARAAAELELTKAAVSHRIRRLEEQLGLSLFDRTTRGLALTKAGNAYLPGVTSAFENLRAATDNLLRGRDVRVLNVSATPTLAAKWLIPRLPALYAAHPGLAVRINTSMRFVDFTREPIDIAIRYGGGLWPGLQADRLHVPDGVFPVCSPALLDGPWPLRSPGDLAHHTLLYVDYDRGQWQDWLDAADVARQTGRDLVRRGLTFDVAYMAIEAAIDGLGVALGYAPFVEADISAGRLVAPFRLSLPSSVGPDAYLVSPEQTAEAPDIRLFRDWLLAS